MPTRLEIFGAKVHEVLDDPSVDAEFFRISIPKHGPSRRVCWLPVGGPLAPPKKAGGTHLPTTPGDAGGTRRVDCAMRRELVEVHVYAETRENVEILFENLLAAISDQLQNVEWGQYQWPDEEEGNAGLKVRGSRVIFQITVQFPVSEEKAPLKIVTAEEHECSILPYDA